MLGNTKTDRNNVTLRNVTVALPLKYLINIWRSFQISLINRKVELKLKWKSIAFFQEMVMITIMLILIILFLL